MTVPRKAGVEPAGSNTPGSVGPRPGDRSPTSVDIAREAGVSQATVSRALNGGRVSETTLRRIATVIDQLGYAPNAAARALVTRRSGVVGVVVADIANPFYPELLEAIGERLSESGLQMLLQNAGAAAEKAATQLLLQHRVDGIIFTTALSNSQTAMDLANSGFPIVLANRVVESECDTVEGDNASGAEAVAEHLVSLGHRRIAVIAGDPDASTSITRTKGFDRRLSELGIRPRPELRVSAGYRYDSAYEAHHRFAWATESADCHLLPQRPHGIRGLECRTRGRRSSSRSTLSCRF